MNMRAWIKTKSCRGCNEQFLPQTTNTKHCWRCAGKSYFPGDGRRGKMIKEINKVKREILRHSPKWIAYENSDRRKLQNRHKYHKYAGKEFENCDLCRGNMIFLK